MRFAAGFWPPRLLNLGKISAGLWPPKFRNLGEIRGWILAAEIPRDLGRILAAEI